PGGSCQCRRWLGYSSSARVFPRCASATGFLPPCAQRPTQLRCRHGRRRSRSPQNGKGNPPRTSCLYIRGRAFNRKSGKVGKYREFTAANEAFCTKNSQPEVMANPLSRYTDLKVNKYLKIFFMIMYSHR